MLPLKIVEKTGGIQIVIGEDGRIVSDFFYNELLIVRDNNTCDCILHLEEKSVVVPKDFLYELAGYIQKMSPDNNIDWEHTFWLVEVNRYHDFDGELHSNETASQSARRLFENIINPLSKTEEEQINQIVTKQLAHYNLLA